MSIGVGDFNIDNYLVLLFVFAGVGEKWGGAKVIGW